MKISIVRSHATENSILSSLSTTKNVKLVTMIIIIVFSLCSAGAVLLSFSSTTFTSIMIIPPAYAQLDLETIKYRNLIIDLGNGIKTNAQLTIPAVGKGPYPGVLLIQGSGALDMNETQGIVRIDNITGTKIYPPTPFFQIAEYLSERGFAILRYDKRGIGANLTILNSNVWGNVTLDELQNDTDKALSVLMQQPEVDKSAKISLIGHSEGSVIAPRVAIDNYDKVKNIILMGAEAQNFRDLFYFQHVALPLLYAEKVLDKNHTLLISVEQASKDPIFQYHLSSANITDIRNVDTNNDAYISINNELRPKIVHFFEVIVDEIMSSSSYSDEKCNDIEGCELLLKSHLLSNNTLNIIENIPSNIGILVLQGENDTFTPVQQAFLIQQKLTEIKHPNHSLITYPKLGHYFYPSSQWVETVGPIEDYVLQDIFEWLTSQLRKINP